MCGLFQYTEFHVSDSIDVVEQDKGIEPVIGNTCLLIEFSVIKNFNYK